MSNAKTFQEWAKEILPIVQAAANGEIVQGRFDGDCSDWEDSEQDWEVLRMSCEYRVKPKTIRIGEYDVPEPMREMPAPDTKYYVADTVSPSSPREFLWRRDSADINWFNLGIVHSTKDAAVLHAKALLSLTEVRN
jgi:hypothetical protein